MAGIKKSTLNFLVDLSNNNNREWFQAHREWFEEAKADFESFVFNLIAGIRQFDSSIGMIEPKDCIFRIFRDVRFSANKLPYKENFGAFIAPGGRKSNLCGYYIHIQPSSSFASGGLYMAPPTIMKAVRQKMVDDRKEFLAIVESKNFKDTLTFDGVEQAKRTPAGFSFDKEIDFYLRLKHITPSLDFPDSKVIQPGFETQVLRTFEIMSPLIKFLNQAID